MQFDRINAASGASEIRKLIISLVTQKDSSSPGWVRACIYIRCFELDCGSSAIVSSQRARF